MVHQDVKSKAQCWELEVVCKSKEYLGRVVQAVIKYGCINFEVNVEDFIPTEEGHDNDGSYTVLMWCSWFNNLSFLSTDLMKIEEELEGKVG